MNQNSKSQFTASMIFESTQEENNKKNLKNVSSSFIKEYVKNRKVLSKKETKTDLDKNKLLLVGFAVTSGNNRAKNTIKLALLPLLRNTQVFEKTKSILLHISSHTTKISLDEIGNINDYIREKAGYTADIVMYVNEDKNLGEALAVTIILSEIESTKN